MLIRCPGCEHKLRVPDTAAGKKARCPKCETLVRVPRRSAAKKKRPPANADEERTEPRRKPVGDRPRRRPAADAAKSRRSASGDDDGLDDLNLDELVRHEQRGRSMGVGKRKDCPECGESIPNQATRCRYCGEDFNRPQEQFAIPGYREEEEEYKMRPSQTSAEDVDWLDGTHLLIYAAIVIIGNIILVSTTGYIFIPR